MVESELIRGDQMLMVVRVWEEISTAESVEGLMIREDGLCLTMTFRIYLKPPRLVVVTVSPHLPGRSGSGLDPYADCHGEQDVFVELVSDYLLSDADRSCVLDEIESFVAENIPQQ